MNRATRRALAQLVSGDSPAANIVAPQLEQGHQVASQRVEQRRNFIGLSSAPTMARAYLSVDTAVGRGNGIPLNAENYDHGSFFAANVFTAPESGVYSFKWAVSVASVLATTDYVQSNISLVGSGVIAEGQYTQGSGNNNANSVGASDVELAEGQKIALSFNSTQTTPTIRGGTRSTFLSGHLIGRV